VHGDALSVSEVKLDIRTQVLLVTPRNLSSATGEWRLLSERAKALRSLGVVTDVLYLHKRNRPACIPSANEWIRYQVNLAYSSLPGLPCTVLRAALKVKRWLKQNPNGQVILSGVQVYPLAFIIPKHRLVVDLHGTLEEWKELSGATHQQRALRYIYPVARAAEKLAIRRSTRTLAVSNPLRDYALEVGASAVSVVPCSVSSQSREAFRQVSRTLWRRKLELNDDTLAFIYCGGLSQWQCIDEAILLYKQLQPFVGPSKLILITPDSSTADTLVLSHSAKAIAMTLPPSSIPGALSAGDVGLMLRESNATNRYAFPNKFSEYLAAGLFIISSPGVKGPSDLITQYELGSMVDPHDVNKGLTEQQLATIARQLASARHRTSRMARCQEALDKEMDMERSVADFASELEETVC
jgi:hypothetical protein